MRFATRVPPTVQPTHWSEPPAKRTVPYKVDPSLTIAISLQQRTTLLKFRQRLQSSNDR